MSIKNNYITIIVLLVTIFYFGAIIYHLTVNSNQFKTKCANLGGEVIGRPNATNYCIMPGSLINVE
jgi:hypothetical protein